MPAPNTDSSAAEVARRGDEIYERQIRPQVATGQQGQVVAIDVDSGAHEIADTALAASKQLLAHHPQALIWFVRIGHRALHRIGGHSPAEQA